MSKLFIRIHNSETNEIVDREMNKQELEALETIKAEIVQKQIDAVSKLEILTKLGITEEEAKLFLS